MEKGTKTYVYGLIDEKNNIFYVGKSSRPKSRFYDHTSHLGKYDIKMKILDIFYDVETYWIEKLLSEGHPIKNKEIIVTSEQWEIGEIFKISKRVPAKVEYNGKVYSSLNVLINSKDIPLSEHQIRQIVKNPNYKLAKQYPINIIL
jgi:predicted GIY-YIG superfamily endonuclease